LEDAETELLMLDEEDRIPYPVELHSSCRLNLVRVYMPYLKDSVDNIQVD